jgi:hypothetical protein
MTKRANISDERGREVSLASHSNSIRLGNESRLTFLTTFSRTNLDAVHYTYLLASFFDGCTPDYIMILKVCRA